MNRTYSARQVLVIVAAVTGLSVILCIASLIAPNTARQPEAPVPTSTRPYTPTAAPTALYGGCDQIEAFVMAERFVKERLKAPATARFPCCYDDYTRSLGMCRYEVTTYVDSENAFGALLRTRFRVVVGKIDNERWQLEEAEFE